MKAFIITAVEILSHDDYKAAIAQQEGEYRRLLQGGGLQNSPKGLLIIVRGFLRLEMQGELQIEYFEELPTKAIYGDPVRRHWAALYWDGEGTPQLDVVYRSEPFKQISYLIVNGTILKHDL